MRDPLERYYPNLNFWAVLPQLADVGAFGRLYEADAEGKKQSSLIMWWVARVYHLTGANVLRDKLEEERMTLASEALFKDPKWHKRKVNAGLVANLKEAWDGLKTLTQQQLDIARTQYQQRLNHQKTLKYPADRVDIEAMQRQTPGVLKHIEELEMAVREEMGDLEDEDDPDGHALEMGLI